jgi:hypothetical protein
MTTRVITLKGRTRSALEQAAARTCEHATTEGCDRVLVVYDADTARVFVEASSPEADAGHGRPPGHPRRRT